MLCYIMLYYIILMNLLCLRTHFHANLSSPKDTDRPTSVDVIVSDKSVCTYLQYNMDVASFAPVGVITFFEFLYL